MSNRVALDTNMLLALPRLGTDVFAGIAEKLGKTEFFVPKSVLEELERVGKEQEKRVVKKAMEKNLVEEIGTAAGEADAALEELAGKGFFIASNDKELRKRIKMLGGKNIYLRQSKFIELE